MESHVDSICRACMITKDNFTHFLTDDTCNKLYTFCTSIQIPLNDDITKSLCKKCYEVLQTFADFKNKCIESNNKLTSLSELSKCETHSDYTDNCGNEDLDMTSVEVKAELVDNEYNNYYLLPRDPAIEEVLKLECNLKKGRKTKNKTKRFKDESSLKRPKKKFSFCCNKCNKKFIDQDRFQAHLLLHDGQIVPIDCKICNKTFRTWSGLRRHKESDHTVVSLESLKCATCGKISKSRHTLKMHELTHKAKQTMICDICGKEFTNKVILKAHIKTHDENRLRPHQCEYCDSRFFSKGTLSVHVARRHTGRRYICHLCNYAFTDKYNLTKHILVHEGKKLHKCQVCEKAFSTRTSLVEHKRIHSGEKPYSCYCCSKQFVSKRRLVDHHRIHTGEKPHKCHLCTQAFTQRGTLKRHIKVHEKNTISLVTQTT